MSLLLPDYKTPNCIQPQNAQQVDWSNKITYKLLDVIVGTQNKSIYGINPTKYSIGSLSPGLGGIGIPIKYNNVSGISYGSYNLNNATVLTLFRRTSDSLVGNVAGLCNEVAGGDNRLLIVTNNSTIGAYIGTSSSVFASSTFTSVGAPVVAAITYNGSIAKFFLNGKQAGPNSSNISYSPGGKLWIGSDQVNLNSANADVLLVAVWGRSLSANEISTISDNPWQLFAPAERRIWVPSTSLEYRSVTDQPKNGSAINYDNSVGAALSMFAHASAGLERDVVTGRINTVVDGNNFIKTDSWYKVVNASNYAPPSIQYGDTGSSIVGIGVQFVKTGVWENAAGGTGNLAGGSSTSYGIPRLFFESGILKYSVGNTGGLRNTWDILTPTNGVIYTVAAAPANITDISVDPIVYINGVTATLTNKVGTASGSLYSSSINFSLMNDSGSTVNGDVSCVAAFKSLNAIQAASWTANPWQVLKEPIKETEPTVPGITRTLQPKEVIGIDWNNPITIGLKAAINGAVNNELVSGNPLIHNGVTRPLDSDGNIQIGADGASTYAYATIPTANVNGYGGSWTVFASVVPDTLSTSKVIAATSLSTDTRPIAYLGMGNTSASKLRLHARVDNNNGTTGDAETVSTAFTAGVRSSVAIVGTTGGTVRGYINGVLDSAVANMTSASGITFDRFGVGARPYTTPDSYSDTNVSIALVWTRRLSDEEIASLNANPWQVFAKIPVASTTKPSTTRTTQPHATEGLTVDWDSPLSDGLRHWYANPNFIKGSTSQATSTWSQIGDVMSPNSPTINQSKSEFYSGAALNNVYNPPGLTFFFHGTINGTVNQSKQHLLAGLPSWGLRSPSWVSNGQVQATVTYTDYTGSQTMAYVHGVSTSQGILTACMTYQRNTVGGLRLFVNGSLIESVDTLDKTLQGADGVFTFGSAVGGPPRDLLGAVHGVWERALSDEEVFALMKNPYQVSGRAPRDSISPKEDRSKSVAQSRNALWNTSQTKPTSAFIYVPGSEKRRRIINPQSDFFKGLLFAYHPDTEPFVDPALRVAKNGTRVMTPIGEAHGATTTNATLAEKYFITTNFPNKTMLVVAYRYQSAGTDTMLSFGGGNRYNGGWMVTFGSGGPLITSRDASNLNVSVAAGRPGNGRRVVMVRTTLGLMETFGEGTKINEAAITMWSGTMSEAGRFSVNATKTSTTPALLAACWDYAMTDAQIAAISRDPMQLITTVGRPLPLGL